MNPSPDALDNRRAANCMLMLQEVLDARLITILIRASMSSARSCTSRQKYRLTSFWVLVSPAAALARLQLVNSTDHPTMVIETCIQVT